MSIYKLPLGLKNTSFVINTAEDKYVLKVFAQNFLTPDAIEERSQIVKELEIKGLPVLELIQGLNGKYCQEVKLESGIKYLGAVSKYIEVPFSESDVNIDIIQTTAQSLKNLHKGLKQVTSKHIRKLNVIKTLGELLNDESIKKIHDYFLTDPKRLDREKEVIEYYKSRGEELISYFERRKEIFIDGQLNHGDFNLNNFLIRNRKIEKIFDFDEMIIAPIEYEVAIAIYYLDYAQSTYTDRLIELFIHEYFAQEEITEQKITDIVMFIKYRAFYRFARYFTYYQFMDKPGEHFVKFQIILDRLDRIDSNQIYEFIRTN